MKETRNALTFHVTTTYVMNGLDENAIFDSQARVNKLQYS